MNAAYSIRGRAKKIDTQFVLFILYILAVPFDDTLRIYEGVFTVTIVDLFASLFVVISIVQLLFRNMLDSILLDEYLALYVFFMVVLIYIPFGDNVIANTKFSIAIIEGIVISFCIATMSFDPIKFHKLSLVFLGAGVVIILFAILDGFEIYRWELVSKTPHSRKVAGFVLPWKRTASIFNNVSSYNTYIAIGLSVVLAKILASPTKVIFYIVLMIFLTGFFMPQSRAGAITLLVIMFFLFVLYKSIFKAAALLIPLALFLMMYVSPSFVIDKFYEMSESSFDDRLSQYIHAFDLLYKNNYFGAGIATFQEIHYYAIHNIFLNVLVGFGVFGLVVFLYLNSTVLLRVNFRLKKLIKYNYIYCQLIWIPLSFIGIIAVLFFASGLSTHQFWIMLGINMALGKMLHSNIFHKI